MHAFYALNQRQYFQNAMQSEKRMQKQDVATLFFKGDLVYQVKNPCQSCRDGESSGGFHDSSIEQSVLRVHVVPCKTTPTWQIWSSICDIICIIMINVWPKTHWSGIVSPENNTILKNQNDLWPHLCSFITIYSVRIVPGRATTCDVIWTLKTLHKIKLLKNL